MRKLNSTASMRMILAITMSILIVGLAASATINPQAMPVFDKVMTIVTTIIGFFFGQASKK